MNIAEQLLLLAINQKNGQIYGRASSSLSYGLSGALLADLMLRGHVMKKGKRLFISDDTWVEDPLLQTALTTMSENKKARDAKFWVKRLRNKLYKLEHFTANQPEHKEILNVHRRKWLGIFRMRRMEIQEKVKVQDLQYELRLLLSKSSQGFEVNEGEERLLILLSILDACKLLPVVLEHRQDIRKAKKQMKKIHKELPVVSAVKETITAIEASVVVAVSVAASTSPSNN